MDTVNIYSLMQYKVLIQTVLLCVYTYIYTKNESSSVYLSRMRSISIRLITITFLWVVHTLTNRVGQFKQMCFLQMHFPRQYFFFQWHYNIRDYNYICTLKVRTLYNYVFNNLHWYYAGEKLRSLSFF